MDGLLEKYQVLTRLRLAREDLEAKGIMSFEGEAARVRAQESKELARRFPGCLREMDGLRGEQLEARLEHVTAVARGDEEPARWLVIMADFHGELRETLAVKRWLGQQGDRRRSQDEELLERFLAWYAALPARRQDVQNVDGAWLAAYQRPPRGRLMDLVWDRLSRRHALEAPALRELLFGAD